MFRMVWRPTVAGVFFLTHMRFGVLLDFGKTCQLRAHPLWASKLTEFLDICNTISFFFVLIMGHTFFLPIRYRHRATLYPF